MPSNRDSLLRQSWRVEHGDCIAVMAAMPEASVDAIVCDPPYGLEFMGKDWDSFKPASSRGAGGQFADGTIGGFADKPMPRHGKRWRLKRCSVCGHVQGGASPCRCEVPEWVTEVESGSPLFARTFQAWCEAWALEALRVLKPGGHLLAFGGTRTYHRLAVGIEDAGFEIRDGLQWLYGSGFPKSLDVSKAIDKRPGVASHSEFAAHLAERRTAAKLSRADVSERVVGTRSGACWNWEHHQFPEAKWWPALAALLTLDSRWEDTVMEAERAKVGEGRSGAAVVAFARDEAGTYDVTAPATSDAERWQGWGTALKPGHEPVVVARKPLTGTVAANVLAHGTGALNVDGCRIEGAPRTTHAAGNHQGTSPHPMAWGESTADEREGASGRWPANVILDEEAAAMLDAQTGELHSGANPTRRGSDKFRTAYGEFEGQRECEPARGAESGGASRFFYCAKADTDERNAGLATFTLFTPTDSPDRNDHPTVKPIDVMRWLVRMVTPPGGTVLDPFTGSGTTGCAAVLEGFSFIGIEREAEYVRIARARLAHWSAGITEEAA